MNTQENKNNKIHKKLQNNKNKKNKFGIDKFDHANMFTMLLHNFCQKLAFRYPICWKYNKYVIIMHLICINHNNMINKPFSAKKKVVAVSLHVS